jgi:SET domain-containing protein
MERILSTIRPKTLPRDVPEVSWHLPSLELRPSRIHGTGVFASTHISCGEVVIIWGGRVLTRDDIAASRGKAHTVVQIDDDLFLGALPSDEKTLDDYMNHSCDPSVWLRDAITLEARRDIIADEELTADYAIWLNTPQYRLACNCDSSSCRTTVTGVDWMLPELQKQYKHHFATFLNTLILSGAEKS